jgi:hypothetical protein
MEGDRDSSGLEIEYAPSMRKLYTFLLPTRPLLYLLGALLLTVATAQAAEEPRGELSLSSPDNPLRGEYSVDDSVIVFSADEQHGGRVKILVDVNGLAVDAEYDPAGPTVYLDGHDAQLKGRDKLVLQALAFKLETDWQSSSDPLSIERDWVLRLVMLLSEAPVGHSLKKRTIHAPTERVAPPAEVRPQSDGPSAFCSNVDGEASPAKLCIDVA